MPPWVINRVNEIGYAQAQPWVSIGTVDFNDPFDDAFEMPEPVNDEDDDSSYQLSDDGLTTEDYEENQFNDDEQPAVYADDDGVPQFDDDDDENEGANEFSNNDETQHHAAENEGANDDSNDQDHSAEIQGASNSVNSEGGISEAQDHHMTSETDTDVDLSIADWMYAPRRSNRIARRGIDPNFHETNLLSLETATQIETVTKGSTAAPNSSPTSSPIDFGSSPSPISGPIGSDLSPKSVIIGSDNEMTNHPGNAEITYGRNDRHNENDPDNAVIIRDCDDRRDRSFYDKGPNDNDDGNIQWIASSCGSTNENDDDSNIIPFSASFHHHDNDSNIVIPPTSKRSSDEDSDINSPSMLKNRQDGISLFQMAVEVLEQHKSIDTTEYDFTQARSQLRKIVDEFLLTEDPTALQHHLVGILLTQMSAKAGIRKHGDKAKEVLFTEFLQLHDMGVFWPIFRSSLSKEQIERTLRALSFIPIPL